MLKVDSIICPYNSKPAPVKQFLMIDFENDCLTTSEWKEGDPEDKKSPINSDLKIKYISNPLKCDLRLRTDRLLQIIQMYELGQKVIESFSTRVYPNGYKCELNPDNILEYITDPSLLAYIDKDE